MASEAENAFKMPQSFFIEKIYKTVLKDIREDPNKY